MFTERFPLNERVAAAILTAKRWIRGGELSWIDFEERRNGAFNSSRKALEFRNYYVSCAAQTAGLAIEAAYLASKQGAEGELARMGVLMSIKDQELSDEDNKTIKALMAKGFAGGVAAQSYLCQLRAKEAANKEGYPDFNFDEIISQAKVELDSIIKGVAL